MLPLILALTPATPAADFQADEAAWRQEYEKTLTGPNGWLSVSGLFWLREGKQTLGSGPDCDIKLPLPTPERLGVLKFSKDGAFFQLADGVKSAVNDRPVTGPLAPAEGVKLESVHIGDQTLAVITRGSRTALRFWDNKAPNRVNFKGCQWFAASKDYVVQAKFIPHKAKTTIPITNVLGDTTPTENPGYVEFKLGGKVQRLEALGGGGMLFIIFKDQTTGHEAYPAGRFLDAEEAKGGKVTLNFNRATNPPCAFTAFATCPLPPAGNMVSVKVLAGEKAHHPGED